MFRTFNIMRFLRLLFLFATTSIISCNVPSDKTRNSTTSENNLTDIGLLQYAGGYYEEAIDSFDAAIEDSSKDTDPIVLAKLFFARAKAKTTLSTYILPDDELLFSALTDYSKAIELAPNSARLHKRRGRALAMLGAYDEAMAEFEFTKTLEEDDLFWSVVRIGGLHRQLGNYEKALQAFDNVAQDWQYAMPVNYHRAKTYNKFGDYNKAIASIEKGLMAQPDYGFAYHTMACSKALLGRYKDALADFQKGNQLIAKVKSPGSQHHPGEQHDNQLQIDNMILLQKLSEKQIEFTSEMKNALCFGSWWDIHYQTLREKSHFVSAVEE